MVCIKFRINLALVYEGRQRMSRFRTGASVDPLYVICRQNPPLCASRGPFVMLG